MLIDVLGVAMHVYSDMKIIKIIYLDQSIAALEAIKQVIHKVLVVRALSLLVMEWNIEYKISTEELRCIQASLLETLPDLVDEQN